MTIDYWLFPEYSFHMFTFWESCHCYVFKQIGVMPRLGMIQTLMGAKMGFIFLPKNNCKPAWILTPFPSSKRQSHSRTKTLIMSYLVYFSKRWVWTKSPRGKSHFRLRSATVYISSTSLLSGRNVITLICRETQCQKNSLHATAFITVPGFTQI